MMMIMMMACVRNTYLNTLHITLAKCTRSAIAVRTDGRRFPEWMCMRTLARPSWSLHIRKCPDVQSAPTAKHFEMRAYMMNVHGTLHNTATRNQATC